MPADELERAREAFLHRLSQDGLSALEGQPLVAYWQSVEAEATQTEDLARLERWSMALAGDKARIAALRAQARTAESSQVGGGADQALALIRHVLGLLDAIEERLNRRLAILRDRMGRWVFLAGPGVKKKPPEGDKGEEDERSTKPSKGEQTRRALIQRSKPKPKPTKTKTV